MFWPLPVFPIYKKIGVASGCDDYDVNADASVVDCTLSCGNKHVFVYVYTGIQNS